MVTSPMLLTPDWSNHSCVKNYTHCTTR